MIKCSFCGHEFIEHDSKIGCRGCPMSKTCRKSNCPNCGFEAQIEPRLIKFIKRKWGKKE